MGRNSSQSRAYKKAIGLGTIAGLRSLSAPALLSHAAQEYDMRLDGTPFAWFESPPAVTGSRLLALGEMVADKLPGVPARTSLPALLGRAGAGALVGAAAFAAEDESIALGAAIGAAAAIAASFGAYNLRKLATDKWGVPNVLAGLIEDAIVVGSGLTLLAKSEE